MASGCLAEWRHLRIRVPIVGWLLLTCAGAFAGEDRLDSVDWRLVERQARGTTVHFDAWGGDESINRYIDWAAREIAARYDVSLIHVRVADIAEAVTRVLAERAAGRTDHGSIDLLWINGENFDALHRARLLYGPWFDRLPNARLIDVTGNPTTTVDFGVPTQGYEVPWGSAYFTLFFDSAAVRAPPRDPAALLAWMTAHPGRFTYPRPPNFLGTSFLKQVLLVLVNDRERLSHPVGPDFATISRPLWDWLDAAHPYMWRHGRLFPESGPAQRELLAVGEVDWAVAFNPLEAERGIARRELPASVRATTFRGGTLANSHFLAIPFNSSSTAGALVVANFLLSPEAQTRKADVKYWGDPTVLRRGGEDGSAPPRVDARGTGLSGVGEPLLEPDPSWARALNDEWLRRYGVR